MTDTSIELTFNTAQLDQLIADMQEPEQALFETTLPGKRAGFYIAKRGVIGAFIYHKSPRGYLRSPLFRTNFETASAACASFGVDAQAAQWIRFDIGDARL